MVRLNFASRGRDFSEGTLRRVGFAIHCKKGRNRCRPCGTLSFFPFLPGTSVPGYLMPPLVRLELGGFDATFSPNLDTAANYGEARDVSCAATMPYFVLTRGFACELQDVQRRTVLWGLGRVSVKIRA